MGAHPLAPIIQEQIKKPIAHELLFGQLISDGQVYIDVLEHKIKLLIS